MQSFERKDRIETHAFACLKVIGLRGQARSGGAVINLLDRGTGISIAATLRREAPVDFAEQRDTADRSTRREPEGSDLPL